MDVITHHINRNLTALHIMQDALHGQFEWTVQANDDLYLAQVEKTPTGVSFVVNPMFVFGPITEFTLLRNGVPLLVRVVEDYPQGRTRFEWDVSLATLQSV